MLRNNLFRLQIHTDLQGAIKQNNAEKKSQNKKEFAKTISDDIFVPRSKTRHRHRFEIR